MTKHAPAVEEMLKDFNKFPEPYELITHEQYLYELLNDDYGYEVKFKQAVPPFAKRKEHEKWPQYSWDIHLLYGYHLQIGYAQCHTYHADKDVIKFPWATHPMCKFLRGRWKQNEGYFAYFFKWGCQHDNRHEMGVEECATHGIRHYGMFDHHIICDDCGFTWGYDSSG